jgi:subfamily B ATP-binding cassette protein MsbA
VDRRGAPALVVPGPADDDEAKRPEWDRMERDHGALTKIAAGDPGALDDSGQPRKFKGENDLPTLGVWAPVAEDSRFRLLAEVPEGAALGAVSGRDVGLGGRILVRLKLWHGILALGMLSLLGALFFLVVGRYQEVGPLVRVYSFARPYAVGIVVTVLVGACFSLSKVMQVGLLKKLGDDVLVSQAPDAKDQLLWIAAATAGIGVVMAVTTFFKDYLQNYYAIVMVNDVRLAIAKRLVTLPLGYFHRMRTGDLNARIERDVAGMRVLLTEVFEQGFVQPFVLVGALVMAFVMNWRLALVLLGLPILVMPLFRIARRIKKKAQKRQVIVAEISHVLFQILSGMKVVKAFGGEQREVERLGEANRRFIKQARKIQRLSALAKGVMDLVQMSGGAILIYLGGTGVLEGSVSLGDLLAFITVVQQTYVATKELTSTFNKVIEGTPAVMRVFEVLDATDTLPDGTRALEKAPLRQGIELRGVSFRYGESDVIHDVDLVVPAGKVLALVGPTGAGKSTICDLVARFYDPTGGAVLYDGTDVREFTKKSLVSSLAIVTQDAFLFNATIEENIRYGRPEATREEVERAAQDAFVHDDILAMDGAYAKVCGERGLSLSGGQRQRITIARAILKDAPVLILDEATSNLDSRSESMVQAALGKLVSGRTVIVVAHRLSTIRNADMVVVVESGRVVEKGPPAELMQHEGSRFRAMVELQQLGDRGRGGEGGGSPGAGGAAPDDGGEDGPRPRRWRSG